MSLFLDLAVSQYLSVKVISSPYREIFQPLQKDFVAAKLDIDRLSSNGLTMITNDKVKPSLDTPIFCSNFYQEISLRHFMIENTRVCFRPPTLSDVVQ